MLGEDLVIEWIDLKAIKSAKLLSGLINTTSDTSNLFDSSIVVIQLREPATTAKEQFVFTADKASSQIISGVTMTMHLLINRLRMKPTILDHLQHAYSASIRMASPESLFAQRCLIAQARQHKQRTRSRPWNRRLEQTCGRSRSDLQDPRCSAGQVGVPEPACVRAMLQRARPQATQRNAAQCSAMQYQRLARACRTRRRDPLTKGR